MDGWRQQGMTLIEVLLAMALLGVGLFAAAGLQLRALQATDSALRATQAAYLNHGVFEQARAVGAPRDDDNHAELQGRLAP
ncbi:prepilin-type N-terminal cleavage/methylation domain-containing protein [Pseudomonas sp. BJa5]|uniref:type IV pilus modification PilV family protein n=1 Tax=Pseudomonas sp. BJa5 TaxID=2936270 RepID=UPI002559AC1D|nr:prepilin-type N-terminal cleavage/methylation domain-containing protein [Pseudomonas sp. BGr12]MDL2423219.1 prepilin-type N-terminal cleavage/methylation domain-containing protein [Pseudomonas sp. BGr12]